MADLPNLGDQEVRIQDKLGQPIDVDNPFPVTVAGPDPLDQANSTKVPLQPGSFTNFTADNTTDTFTSVGHGLSDGDPIVVKSTGTLPGNSDPDEDGLVADQVYYVTAATTDTFKLNSSHPNNIIPTAVEITDDGTGTHSWATPGKFEGPWTRLKTAEDLFMFAFTAGAAFGGLHVEWSGDGATGNVDALPISNLKAGENTDTPGFFLYLDALTTNIDNYYRVVAYSGSGTMTLADVRTWVYPEGFHGTYGGLSDALSNLSTALLTRSVIAAFRDGGTFGNVGATREGYLKVAPSDFSNGARYSSSAVPSTPFKTVPTEVPQDFYRVRFDRNDLDVVLDQSESTGGYTIQRVGVLGSFAVDATPNSKAIARTWDTLEYDPAHGFFMDFTNVVVTDSAEPESGYYMGGLTATNGFGVGRAPDAINPDREFGILHRNKGVDTFIPQSKWNIDKCDGSADSNFITRNATTGEEEVIALTESNGRVWSVVSGYLGFSSTAFFVKPPGTIHYILVHILIHDDPDSSLGDPDLPGAVEVFNGPAGSAMEIRAGSWRGGSYRAREETHVSEQNTRTGSLSAGVEFVGESTEVKAFDQVDVSIIADQSSAMDGIRFQASNVDGEWYDFTPRFNHAGANESRLTDDGLKGVRTFQLAVGGFDRFRVKYKQGAVMGDVDIHTVLVPRVTLTSIHRLGDSTSADRSVLVNKSAIIAAVADDDLVLDSENGSFVPIGQTSDGGLITANPWRVVFEEDGIAAGFLPSGAAPSFDKVGPIVAPNVIDSGWLNARRFKIQFAHLQADLAGLKVFVMNAADDQGNHSRTKNFNVPTLTKSDGFGGIESLVVSAPFFQDYFRVVIFNDTGTDCDELAIRSMGSDTPLGGIMQSLSQSITDEFPAIINQSVIKAKAETTGLYEAIESDGQGRMLVNVGSDFSRLLQRNVENTDKLKLDVEPTNTTHYIGTAPTGTAESATSWDVIGIKLSATKNPTDMEFVQGIAWDDRTNAAHWTFTP